jgi:hypothetical protein
MTWKLVDGGIATYMMEAVEHAADIEAGMRRLRANVCHGAADVGMAMEVRRSCRKLAGSMDMVIHRMEYPDLDKPEQPDLKVV